MTSQFTAAWAQCGMELANFQPKCVPKATPATSRRCERAVGLSFVYFAAQPIPRHKTRLSKFLSDSSAALKRHGTDLVRKLRPALPWLLAFQRT